MAREPARGTAAGGVETAPVAARPAATIVVARPATGRAPVEILALRRSLSSRFAPGFVVFPGGLVDEADRELAVRWFGRPGEAARACAVRELAEEARLFLSGRGLVVATRGIGVVGARAQDGGGHEPRHQALAPEPPAVEDLPEIARWLAPEELAVRFDARFFAVATGAGGPDPTPDRVEADRAWWVAPGDLLRAAEAGRVALMWPTLRMLQALAACGSVEEALGLRVEAEPPPDLLS